jgi:hypothetical protein
MAFSTNQSVAEMQCEGQGPLTVVGLQDEYDTIVYLPAVEGVSDQEIARFSGMLESSAFSQPFVERPQHSCNTLIVTSLFRGSFLLDAHHLLASTSDIALPAEPISEGLRLARKAFRERAGLSCVHVLFLNDSRCGDC